MHIPMFGLILLLVFPVLDLPTFKFFPPSPFYLPFVSLLSPMLRSVVCFHYCNFFSNLSPRLFVSLHSHISFRTSLSIFLSFLSFSRCQIWLVKCQVCNYFLILFFSLLSPFIQILLSSSPFYLPLSLLSSCQLSYHLVLQQRTVTVPISASPRLTHVLCYCLEL